MKLLAYDGPLYQVCRWTYRFLTVSVLLLVCSLPVVTAPPSIAATFGVARRLVRGDDVRMLSAFRALFVENFVQSMVCGWILFAVAGILWVDSQVVSTVQSAFNSLMHVVLWLASILLACVGLHLFPLMVHMHTTNRALMRSALVLCFYKPHLTLLNLLAIILMLKVFAYFPLLLLLLFPGVTVYFSYWIAARKFRALEQATAPRDATEPSNATVGG